MDIKFSIIVPVYNVEKYLDECIQSIINQTYSNWELILIDDGSTDKSGAICLKYAEKDDRIIYFYKENTGQSDSRNIGITKAGGDYMIFVDSDDYIDVDSLERFAVSINEWGNPDVVLSEGMNELFGDELGGYRLLNKDDYPGLSGRDTLLKTLKLGPNWSPCDKAYKLLFWKENEFIFPVGRIAEDFTLIDRVVLKAQSVSCIDAYYTYRRLRKGSSVTDNVKKNAIDDLLGFDDWEQYFISEQLDEELINAFRTTFVGLYCHNSMGYAYMFKDDAWSDYYSKLEKYRFYLNYATTLEFKCVRWATVVVGLKNTCALLGMVKRKRLKKLSARY